MRALVGAALLVVFASAAAAFTNAYEPRVLEIAGRGGDGSVHFAWMGADLRVDGPGGIVAGEMRLKVWGDGGGPVQVLLCIDLRPVEAHPKPPEETIANARLMPVATLFDGELQRRPDARAERVKFRFRVWLPQPLRAHDLWIVALQKGSPAEAADYLRARTYPALEPLNARPFARLMLWDGANWETLVYANGYPGYPELYQPEFRRRNSD